MRFHPMRFHRISPLSLSEAAREDSVEVIVALYDRCLTASSGRPQAIPFMPKQDTILAGVGEFWVGKHGYYTLCVDADLT